MAHLMTGSSIKKLAIKEQSAAAAETCGGLGAATGCLAIHVYVLRNRRGAQSCVFEAVRIMSASTTHLYMDCTVS